MVSKFRTSRAALSVATVGIAVGAALIPLAGASAQAADRSGLADGQVKHVVVIDLENESFGATFGPNSPATYLNSTLLKQGELVKNYFGTGHVSLDNYLSQISGQAPNDVTSADCATNLTSLTGTYNDVTPGTLDPNQELYPGQVDGQGCVMPASVKTIGDQLDALSPRTPALNWREYAEDMGNDPVRDGGQADPSGGTVCAHPTQSGGLAADDTNSAQGPNATGSQVKSATIDQYAARHNPFVYFHSVTDDQQACDRHVVSLGTVKVGTAGQPDAFTGHLATDFASESTTPKFSFISPNLCNTGHDATCAGTNVEGGTAGGLAGADLWLKHWMPLLLNSPAYRSGNTMIVLTFDEGGITDTAAGDNEKPGPNSANPGYSALLNTPAAALGGKTYYQLLGFTSLTPGVQPVTGTMPGGGQMGAVVFNSRLVKAGSVDDAGSYNHYSALRTYEDLLGLHKGGADGKGHLGFASTAHDFGSDVFNRVSDRD